MKRESSGQSEVPTSGAAKTPLQCCRRASAASASEELGASVSERVPWGQVRRFIFLQSSLRLLTFLRALSRVSSEIFAAPASSSRSSSV
eukprot:4813486-Pyramimonas_sp.AAC.1